MKTALVALVMFFLTPPVFAAEEAVSGHAQMDAGVAHMKAGEPEKAAERFREAIRLAPNNPDGHLQLGFSLQKMGQYQQAIDAYKGALELDQRHPYAPEAYYNMGISSDALGDGKNAVGYMKKSLQAYTDRNDYGGVFRVGRTLEQLSLKYPEQQPGKP